MIEPRASGMPATEYDMLQNAKRMMEFMMERHRIYLKRQSGAPGPWTQDEILRDGRFCNIFRELDRVTIWIRKNIREPFADHPNLWYMLAIARYINWPPTLQVLIDTPGAWPGNDNYDPQSMTDVLEGLAQAGEKVYTGAYMIRAESDLGAEWYCWTKHRYIAEVVLGKLWANREAISNWFELDSGLRFHSLQACWMVLAENPHYTGWGPFMTYEWVTDLRHTRYLNQAPDIFLWANAGPGAIRGLNRLYERDLKFHSKPEQTCAEMQKLMVLFNTWDKEPFVSVFGPPRFSPGEGIAPRFEMRDVEHCLCEFDKYERVRLRQGKMRSKYNWTKAQPL